MYLMLVTAGSIRIKMPVHCRVVTHIRNVHFGRLQCNPVDTSPVNIITDISKTDIILEVE